MTTTARTLNALLAIVLAGILLGAFGIQIFTDEDPCALCQLQRLGMIGIAFGALLNLRFGIRPLHYGISILAAIGGAAVAVRQITLHICPGFSTFGEPVWGLSLYTWSCIAQVCAIVYIAICLFIPTKSEPAKLNWFEWLAFTLVTLVAAGNIVSTLIICGLGPCTD